MDVVSRIILGEQSQLAEDMYGTTYTNLPMNMEVLLLVEMIG